MERTMELLSMVDSLPVPRRDGATPAFWAGLLAAGFLAVELHVVDDDVAGPGPHVHFEATVVKHGLGERPEAFPMAELDLGVDEGVDHGDGETGGQALARQIDAVPGSFGVEVVVQGREVGQAEKFGGIESPFHPLRGDPVLLGRHFQEQFGVLLAVEVPGEGVDERGFAVEVGAGEQELGQSGVEALQVVGLHDLGHVLVGSPEVGGGQGGVGPRRPAQGDEEEEDQDPQVTHGERFSQLSLTPPARTWYAGKMKRQIGILVFFFLLVAALAAAFHPRRSPRPSLGENLSVDGISLGESRETVESRLGGKPSPVRYYENGNFTGWKTAEFKLFFGNHPEEAERSENAPTLEGFAYGSKQDSALPLVGYSADGQVIWVCGLALKTTQGVLRGRAFLPSIPDLEECARPGYCMGGPCGWRIEDGQISISNGGEGMRSEFWTVLLVARGPVTERFRREQEKGRADLEEMRKEMESMRSQ